MGRTTHTRRCYSAPMTAWHKTPVYLPFDVAHAFLLALPEPQTVLDALLTRSRQVA